MADRPTPVPVPEDVTFHTPGGTPLLARLHRPSTNGPWPAVIDVHGGRWCAEDRLTNTVIDEALAAAGIFVMGIDFRMPPTVQFPRPVADIAYALKWLRANADRLGIKEDWIGGVGTSSGGHQLMLNALTPSDPRWRLDHPPGADAPIAPLRFAVICWPVTDPPARYRYALDNNMDIHIRSHQAYWPDEAAMADGSPLRLVQSGAAELLPPLLIIQGTNDVILTPDMNDRFAAAYKGAGGEVQLRKFEGEGHTFITKKPDAPATRQAVAEIIDFIHAHTTGRSAGSLPLT
jgi:acetyl esterase/lipase